MWPRNLGANIRFFKTVLYLLVVGTGVKQLVCLTAKVARACDS